MQRYFRRVIRIKAEDSPNVRLGQEQERLGIVPTDKIVVPGILTFHEYMQRRRCWNPQRQCEGLDAQWYEGAEIKLFPPEWLALAEEAARRRSGKLGFQRTIGVDAAEGGDNTCWTVADETGLIMQRSKKTCNTALITGDTIAMMREFGVSPDSVLFDRGGGGKQHADRLREQSFPVRTVGFGEVMTPEPKRGLTTLPVRKEQREEKYVYKNRRAQMFYEWSALHDPSNNPAGYAIPTAILDRPREDGMATLRRQLSALPRRTDPEGRLYLPPKNRRKADSEEECLVAIIGCSPDEADSAALAVHGIFHQERRARAGVI